MQATQAVEYTVTNTALSTAFGLRFNDEIGTDYARETLDCATQFIWGIFQQQNNASSDRKDVKKVSLIVEDIDGVAFNSDDEIHLSARYVGNYSGDVRREVTGVLYPEMTHVWPWNDSGEANGGLIKGIAEYVMLENKHLKELDKKMRTGYSDEFFVELLGKKVDRLWNEYKAKCGNQAS